MNKNLLICFLLICLQPGYAQLLRKDIYDFAPGDYYCVAHYWHTSGGWNVTTRYDLFEITARTYNSDSSLVSYTANRQSYFPQLSPNTSASYSSGTASFAYGNLLSDYAYTDSDFPFGIYVDVRMLEEPDPDSCLINVTEETLHECGTFSLERFAFGMNPTDFPPCFEPVTSSYYVQEGCGGPYGGWAQYGDPSAEWGGIGLIYFNKSGEECGSLPGFSIGLAEEGAAPVGLFPNPASDELNIAGLDGSEVHSVCIYDLNGRLVRTQPGANSFSVLGLSGGTYTVVLGLFNGTEVRRRIAKE
jgi:hypothetical protein